MVVSWSKPSLNPTPDLIMAGWCTMNVSSPGKAEVLSTRKEEISWIVWVLASLDADGFQRSTSRRFKRISIRSPCPGESFSGKTCGAKEAARLELLGIQGLREHAAAG